MKKSLSKIEIANGDPWKPTVKITHNSSKCFKPKYFAGDSIINRARNAILEARALWCHVATESPVIYANTYSKLSVPMENEIKLHCLRHKENFGVYDAKYEIWLLKPKAKKDSYKYCYNGVEFVRFVENNSKFYWKTEGHRLLLVGDYTVLMQESNLYEDTSNSIIMLTSFDMPDIDMIEGVPGCGKTSFILDQHKSGNLVLTPCTEGAEDIRCRLAKKYGNDPDGYKSDYRTIDSYVLNSRRRYDEVWIDEALMNHPGVIFLVCLYSHCKVLHLLGDPNQIPYINRTNMTLKFDKSSLFFSTSRTLSTSYRCPVDVMCLLSKKYSEHTYSESDVLYSLKCRKFTSLGDVPKVKNTKYLVFKQKEKSMMKSEGFDVSSVHEFQGKEADHVIAVRMSTNDRDRIYNSEPHVIVALTRHKKSLTYYTTVDDTLKRFITTTLTRSDLRKHQKATVKCIESILSDLTLQSS